jgi:phosphoribosylanthranilate isomerase
MWIKICGTTNLEDALAAAEAGADAVGFVFAPSPRRIPPKDAARITPALPAKLEKIGVFVNQQAAIILDTVKKTGLTGVQLQGDETPDLAHALKAARPALQVIKTIHMREQQIATLDTKEFGIYDALLFDSGTKDSRGGTGKPFDWEAGAFLIRSLAREFRVIVAGGLKSSNVGEAIELFHPAGVDVVSGVEQKLGKKDAAKIRAFVAAARRN